MHQVPAWQTSPTQDSVLMALGHANARIQRAAGAGNGLHSCGWPHLLHSSLIVQLITSVGSEIGAVPRSMHREFRFIPELDLTSNGKFPARNSIDPLGRHGGDWTSRNAGKFKPYRHLYPPKIPEKPLGKLEIKRGAPLLLHSACLYTAGYCHQLVWICIVFRSAFFSLVQFCAVRGARHFRRLAVGCHHVLVCIVLQWSQHLPHCYCISIIRYREGRQYKFV